MNIQTSATTIRMPSTANLQVDSTDRYILDLSGTLYKKTYDPPVWNFNIQRKQSIFNGFFKRISTTEVVLDWDIPAISSAIGNKDLTFDISGSGTLISITFANQQPHSVACIIDGMLTYLNDLSGASGYYFKFQTPSPLLPCQNQLTCYDTMTNTQQYFRVQNQTLAVQLDLYRGKTTDTFGPYLLYLEPTGPDLRPFEYIDFVSPSLTYAQDLKDTSTNLRYVDVLCRWYFTYDAENQYDKYNFPIFMGYAPFSIRRAFNPPKQIKWESNLPVGQLQFQIYGELCAKDIARNRPYKLVDITSYNTEYLMTFQVSED